MRFRTSIIIRDIQSGFLQRMRATPAPRWVLHVGKVSADGLRLLAQAVVVVLLGLTVGASLTFSLGPLAISIISLFLFAIGFASLSYWIALRAAKSETMAKAPPVSLDTDLGRIQCPRR